MTHPVETAARAAARRLAPPHGRTLATDVEAALHTRDMAHRPDQYLDPISLGSLIVSIATLAWTIYHDSTKDGAAPPPAVITRRVRVQLDRTDGPRPTLDPAEQERIIEVIVEETLNAAQPTPGGAEH
ncbi:hypothetical protein [Streptomyces kebangsaanensis]|uniref:hypothetical protein n=1 Tax=Streptomyces kebangsaanensis TaxID=864058 RepID=UPI00093E9D93|nr:hypothetical protein [Streptomyces kebangsaanensis]